MHGLVLAASEASRLHASQPQLPPLFLELQGRSLFEWQLDTLEEMCDEVTVVLGHGFVGGRDPVSPFPHDPEAFNGSIYVRQDRLLDTAPDIHLQKVKGHLATDHDVTVTAIVAPHWDRVGQAEFGRLGLRESTGHTIVVAGNLVYRDYLLKTIAAEYHTRLADDRKSVVGIDPEFARNQRGVRWDAEGRIDTYGDTGHALPGVSIVHKEHRSQAIDTLAANRDGRFGQVFPTINATFLPVPPESARAINTPGQYVAAKAIVEQWAQESPQRERFPQK